MMINVYGLYLFEMALRILETEKGGLEHKLLSRDGELDSDGVTSTNYVMNYTLYFKTLRAQTACVLPLPGARFCWQPCIQSTAGSLFTLTQSVGK